MAAMQDLLKELVQDAVRREMVKLNKDKQVAFSASLSDAGSMTLGPFKEHTLMILKYVPTNIGDAYNPHTGVFTAPARGAYQFQWYLVGKDSAPSAFLVKNNETTFCAWEKQSGGNGCASQGITLFLEAGDHVFLKLWKDHKVFDNEDHHTTFSGHMLFPM